MAESDAKRQVMDALRSVFDPEIPINIVDLGLIYEVNVDPEGKANILMTLTAPGCPAAQFLPSWVRDAAATVKTVKKVDVKVTFDPPWNHTRMSDEAKLALGLI